MTGSSADAGPAAVRWGVVERILVAHRPISLVVTGGGSRVVSWLLNHPGASRAIVEARIPYHDAAIAAILGPGTHNVAEETGRLLAVHARDHAVKLTGDRQAIGLGATAALATTRQRRGQDRAFGVVRQPDSYAFAHLRLEKGAADRQVQEEVLSEVLLSLLSGAVIEPWSPELPPWAHLQTDRVPADDAIERLLDGRLQAAEILAPGQSARAVETAASDRVLVPGSFRPLHAGHAGLATAAEARSGRRVSFELSVHNVDKPPLTYREILARAAQQWGGRPLVLTREPTFVGKARVLPGCWFAIGYDTAVRLVGPEYYDGTRVAMEAALTELRDLECRFLVAGRHCIEQHLLRLPGLCLFTART